MAFAIGGDRWTRGEYGDIDAPNPPRVYTGSLRILKALARDLQTFSYEVRQNPTMYNIRRLQSAYTRLRTDLKLLGYSVTALSGIIRLLPYEARRVIGFAYIESMQPLYAEDPGPKQWTINREGFGRIEYRVYDPKTRSVRWVKTTGSRSSSKFKRREYNDLKYGTDQWRYV